MSIGEKTVNKANRFIRTAKEAGWETKYAILSAEDAVINVTAVRGPEKIVIEWAMNQLTGSPEYHLHEMQLKIHSRLDAERKLQGKPDYDKYRQWQNRSRGKKLDDSFDPKDPLGEGSQRSWQNALKNRVLPFDPDTDDDATILKAIRGNTLVFVNSISGTVERVLVPWRMSGGRNGVRVFNYDTKNVFFLEDSVKGRTYISFMDPNGVFRAVHLDRLVGVV